MAQTAQQLLEGDEVPVLSARQRLSKRYLAIERPLLGLTGVVLFLIFWEYVGTSGMVNPMFTSAPSKIFRAAVKVFSAGDIYNDMWVSFQEFAVGYLLAVAVGIPLGIVMGWYRRAEAIFDPFVNTLYATPRVALLPLLIIWLGIGIKSKMAVVFLGAVFPILINTVSGMKTIDAALLKVAKSFGAKDWDIFTTVALPSSVPFVLAGLRLAVGRALIGVVVGEMVAAQAGVGYFLSVAGSTFQTDKVFVGIFIIAVAGYASMELLRKLEERFEAWRPQHQE